MIDEKKEKIEYVIEIIVVVLMGITALLTAWASWIGSLHGGNQATNYTTSNNLASEGNSEYNAGAQSLMQDMLLWNDIADMQFDVINANDNGNTEELDLICNKLYYKIVENMSDEMATQLSWVDDENLNTTDTILAWMQNEEAVNTPFSSEEFVDTYFVKANELLTQSDEALKAGKADNAHGDSFGLVTVIYSVSLFLLGMVSTMKRDKTKYLLLAVSTISIIISTIFMLTIPMPTGFNLLSFF